MITGRASGGADRGTSGSGSRGADDHRRGIDHRTGGHRSPDRRALGGGSRDIGHRTSDTRHRASDTWHRTSDSGHRTSGSGSRDIGQRIAGHRAADRAAPAGRKNKKSRPTDPTQFGAVRLGPCAGGGAGFVLNTKQKGPHCGGPFGFKSLGRVQIWSIVTTMSPSRIISLTASRVLVSSKSSASNASRRSTRSECSVSKYSTCEINSKTARLSRTA